MRRSLLIEALISIGFFQVVLTPYSFFWLHMSWAQYGHWCASSIFVSGLAGPALVALVRWADTNPRKGSA